MEERLERINGFLNDHWIDLLIPDDDFRQLTGTPDEARDEFNDPKPHRREIDLFFRRKLYRVFNNGTFENGGRFYGGWWQGIPGRYRKFLTINGYTTAELDYSNMQIAMLYAREGRQLEGDAYAVEGVPQEYRGLLKKTLFKIINARGHIRAPLVASRPPGWDWRTLLEALEQRHQPIAAYFRSGIGIQLQRLDSDIAERVMIRMRADGNLALPVHDSFIVMDGQQDALREAMSGAYRDIMGANIEIAADETLFPQLPHDQGLVRALGFDNFERYADAAQNAGALDYEDHITNLEMQPAYEAYRQRRLDFIRIQGEDWGWRHQFLR
ncbi:hypothetical protein [Nitratireductor thuwali]